MVNKRVILFIFVAMFSLISVVNANALRLGENCQSDDQCSSQYCDAGSCQTSAMNCPLLDVYWSLEPADNATISRTYVGQIVYLNAEFPSFCDLTRASLSLQREVASNLSGTIIFPADARRVLNRNAVVRRFYFEWDDLPETSNQGTFAIRAFYAEHGQGFRYLQVLEILR